MAARAEIKGARVQRNEKADMQRFNAGPSHVDEGRWFLRPDQLLAGAATAFRLLTEGAWAFRPMNAALRPERLYSLLKNS